MRRELIYDLLKFTLSDGESDFDLLKGVSTHEWSWAFDVLQRHGLAAFAYDVVERMPQDIRPPKEVLFKFISAKMNANKSYLKLSKLADNINDLLKEKGIKCLLLKGLSLTKYYPVPESRKFLDIDLYAPDNEINVDAAFKSKGLIVDNDFYRHSHMTLSGVLVENHYCLLDIRGREKIKMLDADLKQMARINLEKYDAPGLYYPDANFSLIFNLHHAMSHFIYEGISFKFLVDWICFIRRERKMMELEQTAVSLRKHGLMKFAAVMTDVSVNCLGLSTEDVPEFLKNEMALLKRDVVRRFVDDLFRPYEKIHYRNIIVERINCVRRLIRASWKPKVFLEQSAFGFVWNKFLPILMGHTFEAD